MPESPVSGIKAHVLRLKPGQDLLEELKKWARDHHIGAASILSVAGSLKKCSLRFADQPKATVKEGRFEIVSLSGMIDENSLHLHSSLSLPDGSTIGGHLTGENIIYTTAEIAIAEYPDLVFTREKDSTYGYSELTVRQKASSAP